MLVFKFGQYLLIELEKLNSTIHDQGLRTNFSIKSDRALMIGTRLYVYTMDELKKEILDEVYSFAYAMHLSRTKMH